MVLFQLMSQDLQISQTSTATILMVSAFQLMDYTFDLLLLDVTVSIQITNQQSLAKISLVMVWKKRQVILNCSGLPRNVEDILPGSTKSYVLQLLILK